MGDYMRQLLKTLCTNSEWQYAVFWKLKHRARMVLTWEDVYYNSHRWTDLSEFKCYEEMDDKLHHLSYAHDPLGLALAKMSCHVYSLGEGIVGQVAVSGKHQWLRDDNYLANNYLSLEDCDILQAQFSAGIRIVLIMPLLPYGVLQLGSSYNVNEDVKLVAYIRDAFLSLQESLLKLKAASTPSIDRLLQQASPHMVGWVSGTNPDWADKLYDAKEEPSICSSSQCSAKQHERTLVLPPSEIYHKTEVRVLDKLTERECRSSTSEKKERTLHNGKPFIGETAGLDGMIGNLTPNASPLLQDFGTSSCYLMNNTIAAEHFGVDDTYIPLHCLDSGGHNGVGAHGLNNAANEHLQFPQQLEMIRKDFWKILEINPELKDAEQPCESLGLANISELHKALGPAFSRKSVPLPWEEDKSEAGIGVQVLEGISSSQLTNASASEHLLEAVVAKVCQSPQDDMNEKSFSNSLRSPVVSGRVSEASTSSLSKLTDRSVAYSIDQTYNIEEQGPESSERSIAVSSTSFSSACTTSHSGLLERSLEMAKNSKKRARPGENRKPRPRDRQLIQDRLKELRELVPSGSKCSIDALLERTIKHMLFLQSITKHADKLNQCAESKLRHSERDMLGSTIDEQGSSWAVEVGSQFKVCSIMVENLNKNGQLLVEMLCEECGHFLEIAEAIRSLGLTILKGVTEAHGEKMWIYFVVEGQNNKSVHRMDILWSLVRTLQCKTSS